MFSIESLEKCTNEIIETDIEIPDVQRERKLVHCDGVTLQDYLKIDEDIAVYEALTEERIVEEVRKKENPDEFEEEYDEEEHAVEQFKLTEEDILNALSVMSDDDKTAEDDKRLSAYLDFINTKTELTSTEKFSYKNDHGTSSEDAVEKFEIFNRAFAKIENDAKNKPLHQNIRVDIKELSPIKCQLLAKGRERAHDKNLKQEIYWATTEKRADDEMSDTKVEKLSFKDVWEDLIHMKSTKQFCKYLLENPDLEKPKYLVDVGFFNNTLNARKKKLDRKSSHENTKSFFPRF
ncbi:uncharacterized protein LOC132940684 [Metopolophium dirhodum]|uniref:uncharacterized protein LOC132940684 n=1 Tax=Metopolophium dirhodum TaxID=44670 RepID=UPI00298F7E17|nr:uncharacterized protein LOC132940684 [Metopolophium dirhodum]